MSETCCLSNLREVNWTSLEVNLLFFSLSSFRILLLLFKLEPVLDVGSGVPHFLIYFSHK